MSEPIKLVAFCGSLRKASFNRLALQAFAERLPAGAACETIEIDWLSRFTPQPFAGKPMAVFGASGGPLGTARSQYHLRQMMIFLDGRFVNKPEVMIGAAPSKFADGKFTDEAGAKLLADLGASLVFAVRQAKAAATVK